MLNSMPNRLLILFLLLVPGGCTPSSTVSHDPGTVLLAVNANHLTDLDSLLETGADANSVNQDGITALMLAVRAGHNMARSMRATGRPAVLDFIVELALGEGRVPFTGAVQPSELRLSWLLDRLDAAGS